jgi:hypothetical protein
MASRKRQRRTFSGMSYREVQRSNSTRRSQLPKEKQTWLKKNGYKNVGWDNVIRLYQKINDLLAQPDEDESTLEDLFLQADRIGQKYQTLEEIETFKNQLAAEVSEISDKIDQQFPEATVEMIDFRQSSRFPSRKKQSSKKYR